MFTELLNFQDLLFEMAQNDNSGFYERARALDE